MAEILEVMLGELLMLTVLGSLVPLALTSIVALTIAILQAATQLQEQTCSYLCKVLSISSYFYLAAPVLSERFRNFFDSAAELIVRIGAS